MKANISRLLIGGSIILVGLALLLDTLNIVNTSSILGNWWPMLFVLGGVLVLVNNVNNYIWATILIIVGLLLQARTLGYLDVNIWSLVWPIALIALGSSVLFNRSSKIKSASGSESDDVSAILGGSEHKSVADDYLGGNLTAVLGGVKLDLRKAKIKKTATINLMIVMGGAEIIVPRGVAIVNKTNSILGGIENSTDQDSEKDARTLIITGDVIVGGAEIKN